MENTDRLRFSFYSIVHIALSVLHQSSSSKLLPRASTTPVSILQEMKIIPTILLLATATAASTPRSVYISGPNFYDARTNATIVLGGPNIVVKAAPYLPSVSGTEICNDNVNAQCQQYNNCTTCSTFNQADVDHIKSRGWNFIRLGVVWAGAAAVVAAVW